MTSNSKPYFFNDTAHWKYVTVIALCLVTISFFQVGNRYETFEQGILKNLDFRQLGKHWIGSPEGITVTPGATLGLRLDNAGRRQTLVTQVIFNPIRYENIHVAADIKLDGVVAGKGWWRQAGIILFGLDNKGARMTYWPSKIALLSGSSDWQRYEAVIPTSATMRRLQLFVLNGGTSGVMEIRNLQIDAVEEARWSRVTRAILISLWLLIGLWILVPLSIRYRKNLFASLSIIAFLVMIAGALTPQPFLSETSDPALKKVASLLATPPPDEAPEIEPKNETKAGKPPEASKDRKLSNKKVAPKPGISPRSALQGAITGGGGAYTAHFVSHFALTLLLLYAFQATPWWRLIGYLLLAAATTEVLQMFIITRSAGLNDGLANLGGVAAGFLLYVCWRQLRNRKTKPLPLI